MPVDGVSSANRTTSTETEDVSTPPPVTTSPSTTSTTQAYDASQAPITPQNGSSSASDAGSFLSNLFAGGGKTSQQQANQFEYASVLGKVSDLASGSKEVGSQSGNMSSNELASSLGSAPTGPQSYDKGFNQTVQTQGTTTIGGVTLSGQASASVYAGAGTQTISLNGPGQVGVKVEADARIGVSASASGSISFEGGQISGSVKATAEIYAHAEAYAVANSKGVSAGASVEVGAHVKAEATADMSLAGGLVTGHADGTAEAGAGGKAGAKVGISYDPLTAAVTADADAFAGARASFDAKGGFAGMTFGVHGEAWAGVGAKVEVDAGITDGKFHFSFGMGVSCGVGTFLKFDFEIDLKPIAKAFGDFFSGLGKLFGGGAGNGSLAAKSVTDATSQLDTGQSATAKKKKATDETDDADDADTGADTAKQTSAKPTVDASVQPDSSTPSFPTNTAIA